MKTIVLAGTTLRVSRLGFGTASLHHLLWRRERMELLKAALDCGITHFDTARMYGEGLAERELGRFLGAGRERVTIGTKFGLPAVGLLERFPAMLYAHRALGGIACRVLPSWRGQRERRVTRAAVKESLERSLRALRTDYCDIFFLHEPCEADGGLMEDTVAYLERQKRDGRIRYLGVAGEASECVAFARWAGGVFEVLQVRDSLENREADCLAAIGKKLQVTYGYLRAARGAGGGNADLREVMGKALERTEDGMILVSSRKASRLRVLAEVAGEKEAGNGS
jgi:aryl-alcohol dehydrogenase-like predicted oxidoreductase